MRKHLHLLFLPFLLAVLLALMFLPSLLDRDAGRVTLDERLDTPLFDGQSEKVLLLFFGYAGCVEVCTPRMEEIAAIYSALDQKEQTGVLFINLLPVEQGVADGFARYFHSDFRGVYPGESTLNSLQQRFNVTINRSLFDPQSYDHTSFLFLLKREADGYRLQYIYTQVPYDRKRVVADIEALLKRS